MKYNNDKKNGKNRDEKHLLLFSFIWKTTEAKKRQIFVLVCREKWDIMQNMTCQNVV